MKRYLHGIHVAGHKSTAQMSAVKLPLPDSVVIPMAMHIGAPAKPVVKVGDYVKTGQLIGEPGGFVSAPIYASVSGTVKKIVPMLQFMGATCQAVVIESDGQMTVADTVKAPEITDYASFINAVRDSGVVGLGGATFPTAVKLDVKDTSRIQEIIINGAECEGYITSDHRTMLDRTDEVVEGCRLLEKWLDVKKIIIAIEDNKERAVSILTDKLKQQDEVELVVLPTRYPQGAEKQLIQAVTGRQVPSGGFPKDVGCAVFNIATCASVCRAVADGEPIIRRIVTITGHRKT